MTTVAAIRIFGTQGQTTFILREMTTLRLERGGVVSKKENPGRLVAPSAISPDRRT